MKLKPDDLQNPGIGWPLITPWRTFNLLKPVHENSNAAEILMKPLRNMVAPHPSSYFLISFSNQVR